MSNSDRRLFLDPHITFARKNQASKETKRLFVFALSTVFVFAGMSLVYAFGISWFSEFIWRETNIINTNVLKLLYDWYCTHALYGRTFWAVFVFKLHKKRPYHSLALV